MAQSSRPQDFLRRGGLTAVICVAIALGLSLMRGSPLDRQLVYALGTGLPIWLLLDFGRFAFQHDANRGWPEGWRAWVLQVGGIGSGFVVGNLLGDAYSGWSTLSLWRQSPRAFAGYLLVSLLFSAGVSYFFYARGRMQYQLRQLAAAQRDAAEAQLKLLQAQLEPHMLFNTLANLRVLIGLDPPRAQAMLDRLIAFLRATLAASRSERHALAAEFERLADYLALMQVRMGDRLAVRFDLPDELRGQPVPPLLLQPLVENAVVHGLEPKVEGGRIELSARRQDGMLQLSVRDTGVGLGQAPSSDGTRFGLDQVRQRLQSLYGPAASFDLQAAADAPGGTLAVIRLPAQEDAR
ncbi:sensor histidine kinase [Aquabacterium sp. J223]|uniref:sensor histidine kinase n=1 Tax=Aquabacterium sp. J223 TaxID=2898431 RepID=UPI0021AE0E90|nr:histidine kinase [Aquabacterium sp. J223]UUX94701.1 histidine kinase [Aquabacterium sp. J223]